MPQTIPQNIEQVVILGSGPAGLTAALYAARAGLNPLLVAGWQPGGQLTITTDVDNFPGYPQGVQGPQMMEDLRQQAERFGTRFRAAEALSLRVVPHAEPPSSQSQHFVLTLDQGEPIHSKTMIIATGASARWLGLESETQFRGRGVSACATCDAFFFRGQPVAVVGGGDTAMEESLHLVRHASHVYLIHRRDLFRASHYMQKRVLENDKITVIYNHAVTTVLGNKADGVSKLVLAHTQTSATQELAVNALFIAIGHIPNTLWLKDTLTLDEEGYIVPLSGTHTHTSIPGVFACGDAVDKMYRQAITAAGSGCMAAMDVERWLAS